MCFAWAACRLTILTSDPVLYFNGEAKSFRTCASSELGEVIQLLRVMRNENENALRPVNPKQKVQCREILDPQKPRNIPQAGDKNGGRWVARCIAARDEKRVANTPRQESRAETSIKPFPRLRVVPYGPHHIRLRMRF